MLGRHVDSGIRQTLENNGELLTRRAAGFASVRISNKHVHGVPMDDAIRDVQTRA